MRQTRLFQSGDNEREKELERQIEELGKGTDLHCIGRFFFCAGSRACWIYFEELKSAQVDRDAIKEQAIGLQKEYDRVCVLLKEAEVDEFF